MAKADINPHAALIHAVIDFVYEDRPKEMMGTTFNLIKSLTPDLDETEIQKQTFRYLSEGSKEIRKQRLVGKPENYPLPTLRDEFETAMKDVFDYGREICFDDRPRYKIFGNRVLSGGSQRDDLTAYVEVYLYDGEKMTETVDLPVFFRRFFDALTFFSADCIQPCAECGRYFFDERGYKRRFCSKRCNDRHALKKSRERAKTMKEWGEK